MAVHEWTAQREFDRRLEWGPIGIEALGGEGTVVIVDVLRFTTAVEAGTSRGAAIYPYRWRDESAEEFATSVGAVLAQTDGLGGNPSPEALAAIAVWEAARGDLRGALARSSSGRELQSRGWADDLDYASAHDVSSTVPVLVDGAFLRRT